MAPIQQHTLSQTFIIATTAKTEIIKLLQFGIVATKIWLNWTLLSQTFIITTTADTEMIKLLQFGIVKTKMWLQSDPL